MWKDSDNQEVGLEAATLQRKRNSSLVESICAENSTGLSMSPKLRIRIAYGRFRVVGEHSTSLRSVTGRTRGGRGRAYADISSDKEGEKPSRRKSKVS